jgi:hypothetical protein
MYENMHRTAEWGMEFFVLLQVLEFVNFSTVNHPLSPRLAFFAFGKRHGVDV